jgi:hypothetical protein
MISMSLAGFWACRALPSMAVLWVAVMTAIGWCGMDWNTNWLSATWV